MVEGGGAASSGTEDAEDVFLLHDEVLLAVQRAQCTTQLVQMLEIDLVYYSNHTQGGTRSNSPDSRERHPGSPPRPRAAAAGATRFPLRRLGMRWLLEFYNERRGILARYGI